MALPTSLSLHIVTPDQSFTHDVDEAILLADRVVMMSNGPRARIGRVMEVPLERPRTREALLEHKDYYMLREELIGFLEDCGHQR